MHRVPRGQRLCASLCALALAWPAAPGAALAQNPNQLPSLGDSVSEDFGVGTERKLGDQIMREIRRDPDYLDDPLLLEYVQSIWQPLLAQARANGNIGADTDERFAWEPFLVRDRSVNAFALPGGFVGVHLGLMAITVTRDELASVLAHEMSHVTQRHIARSIANSKKQSLVGVAALILGLLAASRARSVDGANAAVVGSQAVAAQGQLNFSRDMEREADRVGFAVLAGSGFAPAGMASMFEKLDQSSRLNDSGGYPYLRSHPLTTERIGEARSRAGVAPAKPLTQQLEHTLALARARVLMDTRVDALRRSQALEGDRLSSALGDQLASAYSSALASSLLRDWERADASLNHALALLGKAPAGETRAARAVQMLQAQSLLARGDVARAAAALKPHAQDGSRPVMVLASQISLSTPPGASGLDAELKSRADELQTWVTRQSADALAWSLLGQTWGRLGQPLRSLRAEAESRLALGDIIGAIDRLRAAQRESRGAKAVDFIEASVVDSRLRDVEALRRQSVNDERELR